MIPYQFKIGKAVFAEAVERGRCPQAVIDEAYKKMFKEDAGVVSVSQEGLNFYSGAVNGLVDLYLAVAQYGGVPEYVNKEVNDLMHAGPTTVRATLTEKTKDGDQLFFRACLAAMAEFIKNSNIKIGRAKPAPKAAPAAPNPLEVRVVGMPERVTESSVAYDKDGNIESTVQVEKDATPA